MKSHKGSKSSSWEGFPFLTQRGINLIKAYTQPRTNIGMGRFGAYKEYGESIWRVGYGSSKLGERPVSGNDRITQEEAYEQLVGDLKEFSQEVALYVYVGLNRNRRAAILSFAHSIGILAFSKSKLLQLINRHASKTEIISEWSPYINQYWLSGGDVLKDRRKSELDMYLSPDKKIPTFTEHKCSSSICLLNLPETYNGAPNQIKAIEYLEKKFKEWDPTGHALRRFYRLWAQTPAGLGQSSRVKEMFLEDLSRQEEQSQGCSDV